MKIRLAIAVLVPLGVALSCASGFARQEYVTGELTFFSGGKLDEWGNFYPKLLGIALQGSDSDGGSRLILEFYYYTYYGYDNVDSWLLGIDSFGKLNLGLLNPYWGLGLGWPYFRLLAGMNLSLGSFQAYVEFNKTFAFGRIPGEQLKLGIGWVLDRTSRQKGDRTRGGQSSSHKSSAIEGIEVSLFTAQTVFPNSIRLSWEYEWDKTRAIFVIERRSETTIVYSEIWAGIPQRHAGRFIYIDKGITSGVYYYRVKACAYAGEATNCSPYSREALAKAIGWVKGPSLEIVNLAGPVYIDLSGLFSDPENKAERLFANLLREFGSWREDVSGEVINNGTVTFRYVELVAKFYDSQGVLIDTGIANTLDLQPGEVWAFTIPYLGPDDRYPNMAVVKVSKAMLQGE